ncbi:hypothetical protein DMN91_009781 [Ooceraea biroi]|uniref:Uncharacterized protein n=1 Tax=Ooceraea biroi TaxID=2015173 RepID=A0A3L8DAK9_OOCBI|nr:hypothetical protein DMN91_009781 [Ooceraea biroi]
MGTKQKLFISTSMIADAIIELYPFDFSRDTDVEQIFQYLKNASRQSKNSVWERICCCILPNKDERTIKSYVPKTYKIFLRYFEDILKLSQTLLKKVQNENCDESTPCTSHDSMIVSSSDALIVVDCSSDTNFDHFSEKPSNRTLTFLDTIAKTDSHEVVSNVKREDLPLKIISNETNACFENNDQESFIHQSNSDSSVSENFKSVDMWVTVPATFWQRFWSSDKRLAISKLLQVEAPSTVKNIMMANASEKLLEAGNLNDVYSLTILQKIASENNSKDDLDPNYYAYMRKLIDKTKENWKGTHIQGFIQQWSLEPFYVTLFTEKQIKILLSLGEGKTCCHFDATGSLFFSPPGITKRLYYYSLILPGNKDCGQFPVAELISSVHSTTYICHFFKLIAVSLKKLTTRTPAIEKIETDFSLALIQGAIEGLNGITLLDYLHRSYNDLVNKTDMVSSMTVLHICSTHMINTVIRKGSKICQNESQVRLAGMVITKLIHSRTLKSAEEIFCHAIKIFDF